MPRHAPSSVAVAPRLDALVDVTVKAYAPLPEASLHGLVSRLRYAVPQHVEELRAALHRAKRRLAWERTGGVTWYWPQAEVATAEVRDEVRVLAPFDPVVWDRRRFEAFWGWPYRFEAYTPAPKRKYGYYAHLVLWRDAVVGWANVSATAELQLGWVAGRPPRERAFHQALELERERLRAFLSTR